MYVSESSIAFIKRMADSVSSVSIEKSRPAYKGNIEYAMSETGFVMIIDIWCANFSPHVDTYVSSTLSRKCQVLLCIVLAEIATVYPCAIGLTNTQGL